MSSIFAFKSLKVFLLLVFTCKIQSLHFDKAYIK